MRAPISVGEEYIVTIEEMGKDGTGVAKLRGVSILVNNTNPGDKAMIRSQRWDVLMHWLKCLIRSNVFGVLQ